jgi:hypothetical protein
VLELRRHVTLAWTAALLAAAGCGGGGGQTEVPAGSPEARVWVDNAARLVEQLQRDITLSATGGSNLATARRAVGDDNAVYLLLVAYGDFAGCNRELGAAGTPSRHGRAAAALILSACAPLERSAMLFERAMRGNDPRSLLAATQTAATAAPILVRALAALDTLR